MNLSKDSFRNYLLFSNLFKWIYLFVNLLLCAGTPLLNRIAFTIFGGLGSSMAVVDFLVREATVAENAWVSISFGTVLSIGGCFQRFNLIMKVTMFKTRILQVISLFGLIYLAQLFFGGAGQLCLVIQCIPVK